MATEYYQRILEVRTQKGFTQRQLAELAQIAPGSLSAYEKGQKAPPVDVAARIAKALGVSLDWLFGFDESKEGDAPKTYGDIIKALLPVVETNMLHVRISRATYYTSPYDTGSVLVLNDEHKRDCENEYSRWMDAAIEYGGRPTKEAIDTLGFREWAQIEILDQTLAKFLESWAKLRNLKESGEVPDDVYQIWLDKRIADFSDMPLFLDTVVTKGITVEDESLPF